MAIGLACSRARSSAMQRSFCSRRAGRDPILFTKAMGGTLTGPHTHKPFPTCVSNAATGAETGYARRSKEVRALHFKPSKSTGPVYTVT